MKVDVPFLGGCLLLVFSLALHGCVPWEVRDEKPPPPPGIQAEKEEPAPADDGESTAQCAPGGKFDCDGGSDSRKWCAGLEERCAAEEKARGEAEAEAKASKKEDEDEEEAKPCPKKKSCVPECSWSCEAQKCHQQCAPTCLPPVCTTRCSNFNTDGCKMECGQPSCSVVCPKDYCPRHDCPQCETRCGEAVCKMSCPETKQNCRHVCAKPACKWECSNPKECPKPKCQLKCQKTRDCTDNMNVVDELPPLQAGEYEVADIKFKGSLMPASLLQGFAAGGMRVNITNMGQDHSLRTHEVELSLAQAVATTWIRKLSKKNGQIEESEASCANGKFQCQGDAAWCTGQAKILCKRGQQAFLQQQSRSQEGQLRKCKESRHMLNVVKRASHTQGHLQP